MVYFGVVGPSVCELDNALGYFIVITFTKMDFVVGAMSEFGLKWFNVSAVLDVECYVSSLYETRWFIFATTHFL